MPQVQLHILDWFVIGLYFAGILFCGIWFSRHTRSTKDFFFGGQRFAWWLVAVSCVATLVGSYSFLIYSEQGFNSGISSIICYTNEWFILPLFILGWLPIIYFSRVASIPEYFERRFDARTRSAALVIILIYLIGYIGINLYTIGEAVNSIIGPESNMQLSVGQLQKPQQLVMKIKRAQDPLSRYINNKLPQATRQLLVEYQAASPPQELRQQLVAGINTILQQGCIYEAQRFRDIGIDVATKSLLSKTHELDDNTLQRVNRNLFNRYYAQEIGKDLTYVYIGAIVVALISAIYMHSGGQTSVIMTDLLQGFILLTAGLLVFFLGIAELGGFSKFWQHLPLSHKLPFPGFNKPNDYHAVGLFWSDAITATTAFYCMNQGILMRFMSTKSVREGKKAMFAVVLVLMPIAAVAVSGAGWVGKSMAETNPSFANAVMANVKHVFTQVAYIVCAPGIFGLVMAALVAALMSTLDTLINAVSAVAVNDIWRSKIKPGMDDRYYLHMGRYFALGATGLGMLLVPVFAQFKSIFLAFTDFCSLVIPPMVVVIALGVLWKRFTPLAALGTLVMGFMLNFLSLIYPKLIFVFAHGVDPSGSYAYMRAFFGIAVSLVIALVLTAVSKPKATEKIPGLTISTLPEGQKNFKGGIPSEEGVGKSIVGKLELVEKPQLEANDRPSQSLHFEAQVHLSTEDMHNLCAQEGDLLYIADARKWLGGLRSVHARAGTPHREKSLIKLVLPNVKALNLLLEKPAIVEKIM